jgi:septum formation protein
MMRLYLASRSPRRRELLHQMGIDFDTLVFRDGGRADFEIDETPHPGEDPLVYVERVARPNRSTVKRSSMNAPAATPDSFRRYHAGVCNGEIIGKPVDAADATAILQRLSGQTHRVLTGVSVTTMGHTEFVLSSSEVRFRVLESDEIRHYVMSGEPMDKAGAYGIQGRAGIFVEHLAGSYTGVMGLPVCETGELLKRFGFRLL